MLTVRDSGLGILGLGTWDWGLSRDRGSGIGDRGSGIGAGLTRNSSPRCGELPRLLPADRTERRPARAPQSFSGIRAGGNRRVHRHGEHRSRTLRSEAVSSRERNEARRFPQPSGCRSVGEEAPKRLTQPSLRRFILRERRPLPERGRTATVRASGPAGRQPRAITGTVSRRAGSRKAGLSGSYRPSSGRWMDCPLW
jgi:hypothetical protein